MTKLELYLTVSMRDAATYLNKKGLIHHFKRVSSKNNPYRIVGEDCPKDNWYCTGTCHDCWESFANKVLRKGGPVL